LKYADLHVWWHEFCDTISIVEFRIDIESEGSVTVVRIIGRLSNTAVKKLIEACDQVKGAIVMDLSDLRSADTSGISAIQRLSEKGAEIRGASPFIHLLLKDVSRE